ncbi:SIMPL domain-containing protein [Rhodobacteraceae bacterium NNCM2]|nr:SIMPL domain-containing protein [Coraliihabitans acroporae]
MRRLISAAAIIGLLSAPAIAGERPSTIRMTGSGTVTVVPDEAKVSLGVVTIGATAAEAMDANAPKVAAIIAMLKDKGVKAEDLRTSDLSIFPRYDNRQNGEAPTISGYQVSNTVEAQISSLDGLGEILDAAIKAGATNVNQLVMSSSTQDKALDEARLLAVKDATRRAEMVAEAAGVTLGPIRSIREGAAMGPGPGPVVARGAMMESVPIEAGSTGISAQITIVWEIEQPE